MCQWVKLERSYDGAEPVLVEGAWMPVRSDDRGGALGACTSIRSSLSALGRRDDNRGSLRESLRLPSDNDRYYGTSIESTEEVYVVHPSPSRVRASSLLAPDHST